MNNTINLKIKNYSIHLKTQQIINCLNLLPDKYRNLDNKVYIFKSYYQYLFYCLNHFMLISLLSGLIKLILFKLLREPIFGNYTLYNKNIYIYESSYIKYAKYILNQRKSFKNYDLYKDYVSDEDIKVNLHCYVSYMLLDALIHELTHALQHKENTLTNPVLKIFNKWENVDCEIDAVKASIEIFNEHHEDFIKILNVKGIHINHSLDPLKINYKFKFYVKPH